MLCDEWGHRPCSVAVVCLELQLDLLCAARVMSKHTLKLADVCSMLTVVYMTRLIKLLITYDGHIEYGM